MKIKLLHILFTILFFGYALPLSAQNLGITTPGTTGYPQTIVGNVLTEVSNNAGNFLILTL